MEKPLFPEELVRQMLLVIGENPDRDGLLDTPDRVVRMWGELFSGYKKDPAEVFKTFESDGYDQMVVLRDIEFYSMCEHHMLPFFGRLHIAYIPSPDGKVIGVSKLARLAEIFTRRLQIQERIGKQIVEALDEHLKPLGSACIIEATHLCMVARGVQKQNSVMVTSAVTGVFRDDLNARQELMTLIKGIQK